MSAVNSEYLKYGVFTHTDHSQLTTFNYSFINFNRIFLSAFLILIKYIPEAYLLISIVKEFKPRVAIMFLCINMEPFILCNSIV